MAGDLAALMRRVTAAAVLLAAPLALAAALWFGSVDVPAREWLATIAGGGSETSREIVWGLRAPRALAAFAVGALLAVAGTLLQVLLRNPLADPTILGVSGGAAVGAMVGLLLAWPQWGVQAAALGGACAAGGALLALALRLTGWNIHRVLLTGVAIGAACGAIVSLLLALAPPGRLHGMLFWLLGDLSGAEHPLAPWIAAAVVVAAAQVLAPRLDALALGTLKARSLGVAGRRDADDRLPRGHGRDRGGGARRRQHRLRRARRAARAAARRLRRPPAPPAARRPCRRSAPHRRGHARAERRRAARVPGRRDHRARRRAGAARAARER